ncbi:hypothetical protein F511_07772 [Dorcoceras hygrometricum]|uniref:CCHC-type domain-containing protein n=1 Tax=Dorcoceras hygrometricum TaxID=472368 RepID=A0A2Z7CUM2_9LAMI|nr:hypothetical protein F511_07772 [Dorcoceras hygrometricum]
MVRTQFWFYLSKQLLTARTKLKTAEITYPKAQELSGLASRKRSINTASRVPLQRRLRPPNWYQSKELLKTSSMPPVLLQTTAKIDGNLPEKGLNEQFLVLTEDMSKDAMSLFIKFGKFMRKHNTKPSSCDSPKRNFTAPSDDKCYNCGRLGHFMADFRKPRRDEKKRPDRSNNKDKKEKKVYQKGRMEKAMVAEENKSAWLIQIQNNPALEPPHQAKVKMKYSVSWPMTLRRYLIFQVLNLHKTEIESCATNAELVDSSNMQAALSKLVTKNEELRSKSEEMLSENQRLARIISSWTRSSASLQKLHGATKPSGDRTGLGYNIDEGSTSEISNTPRLERTKSKT